MPRSLVSGVRIVRAIALLTIVLTSATAGAATLCVNPGGSHGCYASIQDAVNAAAPHDTVRVANGIYNEGVVIPKPLSLIGSSDDKTVIDALGHNNGVYVNGLDNPGLTHVTVMKFKIQNASFEGVLITNATNVTIADNDVVDNDKALTFAGGEPACPGLPPFETAEAFDCGEAIHLTGVTHSTIAGNFITRNSGGILVSNETGTTSDNVITENVIIRNPYDCGLTIAAHPPYVLLGVAALESFPITRNTFDDNDVIANGLKGEGAGVGIFAVPGVGGTVTQNVIIHNRLIGNSIPGVAFHSHAPGDNLDNNMIIENYIARNGADRDDTATPGPTGINVHGASPIRGTLILKNTVEHEMYDLVVHTDAMVTAHLNSFVESKVGVDNAGPGPVDADENWWGCRAGPGHPGCTTAMGSPEPTVRPWLKKPFTGTDEQMKDRDQRHDHDCNYWRDRDRDYDYHDGDRDRDRDGDRGWFGPKN